MEAQVDSILTPPAGGKTGKPLNRSVLSLSTLILVLCSCDSKEPAKVRPRSIPGEIQILNSCGLPKVAGQVRDLLMRQGFDVIEVGNGSYWNYEETIIALRNPHWPGGSDLAKTLRTKNLIPLENNNVMVDATIYIGKDIIKVLENEYNEKDR